MLAAGIGWLCVHQDSIRQRQHGYSVHRLSVQQGASIRSFGSRGMPRTGGRIQAVLDYVTAQWNERTTNHKAPATSTSLDQWEKGGGAPKSAKKIHREDQRRPHILHRVRSSLHTDFSFALLIYLYSVTSRASTGTCVATRAGSRCQVAKMLGEPEFHQVTRFVRAWDSNH